MHSLPGSVKNFFPILALTICGLAATTLADDFKSMVIAPNTTQNLPRVHADQFMVIRNFTQDGGTTGGVVTITKPPNGGTIVNVLNAAVLDPTLMPETINSIIIAGPADVAVSCGDATGFCFISFKKDSN